VDGAKQSADARRYAPTPRTTTGNAGCGWENRSSYYKASPTLDARSPFTKKDQTMGCCRRRSYENCSRGRRDGLLATSLFHSALTTGTYTHYSSNLTSFFKFCTVLCIQDLVAQEFFV